VQLKAEDKLTLQDINKARITRDMLENQCMSSHFEEYVKGSWVRILVGTDQGQSVYRLGEVVDIASEPVEPYPLNGKTVNQLIDVRHGAQAKLFHMSKVSCGTFTEKEFERLIRQLEADKIKPPTRAKLEKKGEAIHNMDSKPKTEAEIAAMIARQRDIRKAPTNSELYSKKSSLNTQRSLAAKRQERDEVARLNRLITEIEEELQSREDKKRKQPAEQNTWTSTPGVSLDVLARVNERNRKANLESMRKADLDLMAKRRREAAGGAGVAMDLSARVKTVVKTHFDSRAGTPGTPAAIEPLASAGTAAAVTTPSGRSRIDDLARSVVIDDLF